jgi:hypothetical protein
MSEPTEHSSNVDIVCILLIITLVVSGAVFWVSGQ